MLCAQGCSESGLTVEWKVPGLGDLPVIGKLFHSKSVTKSRDELLVLITPRIVKPLAPEAVPAGPTMVKPLMGPTRAEENQLAPAHK